MNKKNPYLLPLAGFCLALQMFWPMHASADTVYTMTNLSGSNAIAAYDRNPETGRLTYQGLYPTGGSGDPDTVRASQDALVVDGKFLVAVNPGSNNVSVFRIHRDGSLELTGAPVSSGGLNPVSIAISNRGIAYISNRGDQVTVPANYSGFQFHDGKLTPIPDSTVTFTTTGRSSDILFRNDGRLLIGVRPADNIIDTFDVSESGHLSLADELTGQNGAFAMVFNPVVPNQLDLLLAHLPGLATYDISRQGKIQFVSSAVDSVAVDPCWIVDRNDGTLAWVAGFAESGVSLNQIAADGTVTLISRHDTHPFGNFSTFLAADRDQRYMYLVIPGADIGSTAPGLLHVMAITGDTANGGLSDIQTIAVPQSTNPIGLVIVRHQDNEGDD